MKTLEITSKRATVATLKSFIKKNLQNLFIARESSFNGQSDCVDSCDNQEFHKAEISTAESNALGIKDTFLTYGTKNWITAFDNSEFIGFNVYNCCGSFTLAIKK